MSTFVQAFLNTLPRQNLTSLGNANSLNNSFLLPMEMVDPIKNKSPEFITLCFPTSQKSGSYFEVQRRWSSKQGKRILAGDHFRKLLSTSLSSMIFSPYSFSQPSHLGQKMSRVEEVRFPVPAWDLAQRLKHLLGHEFDLWYKKLRFPVPCNLQPT